MKESFGKLYCLPDIKNNGEWTNHLIKRISKLRCSFEEETETLPNGIDISYSYNTKNKLGEKISNFLVRSYVIKYITLLTTDGGTASYLSPINIVLDKIDRKYNSIINKEAVESIKWILNHPHFNTCKSIQNIEEAITTVNDLNLRFLKL